MGRTQEVPSRVGGREVSVEERRRAGLRRMSRSLADRPFPAEGVEAGVPWAAPSGTVRQAGKRGVGGGLRGPWSEPFGDPQCGELTLSSGSFLLWGAASRQDFPPVGALSQAWRALYGAMARSQGSGWPPPLPFPAEPQLPSRLLHGSEPSLGLSHGHGRGQTPGSPGPFWC